ncbi:putative aldouronate transport system substrate-binding protein [Paenibacillus sp. BK033]|uniref:extracellular solute-binding protein n=1 Tax=Paenibacillus sp. BK033 TaxID=2512133 RepID=UPI0010463F95|nr:extracellular solute-binding protein [Paenibacillus sp. BK033]TCM99578.1 putative aldouronate transport system substrate-binding protein [Paenibacillus sp. BK033]
MKHGKKVILASVLAMSLMAAGCSSNSNNNANSGATNASQTNDAKGNSGAEKEAPIEISIGSTWNLPSADGNPTQKYLEEKYNVKFINMNLTDESFKLKLASNEIPDIFPGTLQEADMANYARQGIIASISTDEIKQYMPKYSADIDQVDTAAWGIAMVDGKNYGVPRIWLNGRYGFIPTYNGAWLNKIGYTEAPKTLEEYEDVLTKFRNDDPDGNGKKDTYGMTGRGKSARNQLFNEVFAAYGVNPYQFMAAADGTVTWGGITDQAKEAVKKINQWYNSDLIDPEFLTDDQDQINTKWNSRKIGIKDNYMYHHLFGQLEQDKANGFPVVYGKGLIGPAGKSYVMSNGPLQTPLMFGKQLEKDDKKRIKILQMLEDLATNDEVYLRTTYGEEGKSYDMVDGVPVWKKEYLDTPQLQNDLGTGGYYNPFVDRSLSNAKFQMPADKQAFSDKLNAGNEIVSDLLGPTPLESKTKYLANLNTLEDSFYSKVMVTKGDAEKEFEAFKSEWLKAGGQEMLDEATKVYQERQAALK